MNEPSNIITIDKVERIEFDFKITHIDEKIIRNIEKLVKSVKTYSFFITTVKSRMGMEHTDYCRVYKNLKISENHKIELHHYPLTLYDITEAIAKRDLDKLGYLYEFDVAEKVIDCHISGRVSLIPLSQTAHNLYHSNPGMFTYKEDDLLFDYHEFVKEYGLYINPAALVNVSKVGMDWTDEIKEKTNYAKKTIEGVDLDRTIEYNAKKMIIASKIESVKQLEVKGK